MPATREGVGGLPDFCVYGMLRASDSLGNTPVFLRSVVETGLRNLMLDRSGGPGRVKRTRSHWGKA